MKPIHVYGHNSGANPFKVLIILEELNIPYEFESLEFADLKKEPYVSINPNGRVPAITDPNTGITLWESGAIVEYLISTYDNEGHKLSFDASSAEQWHAKQYLYFQVSGQGPYFGQAAWFLIYHPERVASATERYLEEIRRVTSVLDGVLAKGNGRLVGGTLSFADLAFVSWYWLVGFIDKHRGPSTAAAGGDDDDDGFETRLHADNPHWSRWINELEARPSVKKIRQYREKLIEDAKAEKK